MSQPAVERSNRALIGTGRVMHARLRPTPHEFAYPTYFLMLPLRQLRQSPLKALHRNRFGLVGFHDRDHGDGRADCLEWIDDLLAAEGIADAGGEVWLHCYPRVLGHTFKPVSFWYCHRADDSLAAIVVEVNNTFGERHCYLLHGAELAFDRELTAHKVFHVSPFCDVTGRYRFRFARNELSSERPARTTVRIDHDDNHGPLIRTSITGRLAPLTARSARAAFFGMPLMTVMVVARIHWQALKLWLKRVPFMSKPKAPDAFVSQSFEPRSTDGTFS